MKAIIIISLLFAISANAVAQTNKCDSVKSVCINQMIFHIDSLDGNVGQLSIFLLELPTKRRFPGGKNAFTSLKKKLDNSYRQVLNDSSMILKVIDNNRKKDFLDHLHTFNAQYELMKDRIKIVKPPIYSSQVDFMENGVNLFQTGIGILKQYLRNLLPVIPDKLLQNIRKRIDTTDMKVKVADSIIGVSMHRLNRHIHKVDKKADSIIKLLQPKTDRNHHAILAVYHDALFGVSYLQALGRPDSGQTINNWGVEFLFPINSSSFKSVGGFALYGLRYDKILIEAGLGYLSKTRDSENVSWKCGILFAPGRMGIGFGYSPLTNTGIQLTYRW